MKRTITRTRLEEIDVTLSAPKYITYLEAIYYRFLQRGSSIEVVRISKTSGFEIQVRHSLLECDWEALFMEADGYKETTSAEFNAVLMEGLDYYGLLATETA